MIIDSMPQREAATIYTNYGWSVFPVHTPEGDGTCSCQQLEYRKNQDCTHVGKHPRTTNGFKNATTDIEIIQNWWRRWPDANVGIATGAVSGLVVVDVDFKKGGRETLDELEETYGQLPDTVTAKTGNGIHFYFKHPGETVKSTADVVGLGVDIRADGGYVVAPPSRHFTGRYYEWEVSSRPQDVPVADLPNWILALNRSPKSTAKPLAVEDGEFILEGSRNATLASTAGHLRRERKEADEIYDALLTINETRCVPSLGESEVRQIANSIGAYPPGPTKGFTLTDTGNGKRFVEQHGGYVRYVPKWINWLIWNGSRWELDEIGQVIQLSKATAKSIYREAEVDDEKKSQKISAWAKKSENQACLFSTLKLAQSEPGIPVLPDQLDTDLWLLNVENGTVDLRTGQLRPANKNDLITKMAPVKFEPDANCPRFMEFLDTIMGSDQGLIGFLQRYFGYSLTGDISEQVFAIFHGQGANGKSTLIETFRALMGDYSRQANFDTFLNKKSEGVRNDLARLQGARFVSAVEVEEGRDLSEVAVKQVTGGEKITARYLFHENFEYMPQFKLFLAANHRPGIRGTDDGIWRRIRLVPFNVTIPEEERDPQLLDKLKEELPGILNWAIQGCRQWQKVGLMAPKQVTAATDEYRAEMDIFAAFLGDCCDEGKGKSVSVKALTGEWKRWCSDNAQKEWSRKAFNQKMRDRDFTKQRKGGDGRESWDGLELKQFGLSQTTPPAID